MDLDADDEPDLDGDELYDVDGRGEDEAPVDGRADAEDAFD
jgi:hypothetical protein